MSTGWDRRFFESTRGRVVTLLRRAGFTVDELARELDLTNNGVRAHLATLERDGIVRQSGVVRRESGGGKPAYLYELTPEAEDLFPKAYEPVLHRLLDVLAEQLEPDESEALLRSVGRLMAEGADRPERWRTRAARGSRRGAKRVGRARGARGAGRRFRHPRLQLSAGRRDAGAPGGMPHGRDPDHRTSGRAGLRALRPRREATLLLRGGHRRRYRAELTESSAGMLPRSVGHVLALNAPSAEGGRRILGGEV